MLALVLSLWVDEGVRCNQGVKDERKYVKDEREYVNFYLLPHSQWAKRGVMGKQNSCSCIFTLLNVDFF